MRKILAVKRIGLGGGADKGLVALETEEGDIVVLTPRQVKDISMLLDVVEETHGTT